MESYELIPNDLAGELLDAQAAFALKIATACKTYRPIDVATVLDLPLDRVCDIAGVAALHDDGAGQVLDGRCGCGHRYEEHGLSGCAADDEAAMGGCDCTFSVARTEELPTGPQISNVGIRIESDGTAAGSYVRLDGQPIYGLTGVTWRAHATDAAAAVAVLEFDLAQFDANAGVYIDAGTLDLVDRLTALLLPDQERRWLRPAAELAGELRARLTLPAAS